MAKQEFVGDAGNNVILGSADGDILRGLEGDDTYTVNNKRDEVDEAADEGDDTVLADVKKVVLDNNVENLTFLATGEKGTGNSLDNEITGNADKNKINGRAGDDVIDGNGDKDTLTGGDGADTFLYNSLSDSFQSDGRDTIKDFDGDEGDLLDLSGIDAVNSTGGDDAFDFIDDADFSGTAGELRFAGGLLQGDTDGDGVADLEIKLGGSPDLNTDFILL